MKKQIKQYVEESNEEFLQASPEKKRVMIAEDVLLRIDLGLVLPYRGNFWANRWDTFGRDTDSEVSVKEVLNRETTKCRVCAKGALFCSLIGRVNKLSVGELDKISFGVHNYDDGGHQKLLEFFSLEQVDLIETGFEGSTFLNKNDRVKIAMAEEFAYISDSNTEEWDYAQRSRDRMERVMKNIIAHNGEFVPEADLSPETLERINQRFTAPIPWVTIDGIDAKDASNISY